jgi:hypothetical protein
MAAAVTATSTAVSAAIAAAFWLIVVPASARAAAIAAALTAVSAAIAAFWLIYALFAASVSALMSTTIASPSAAVSAAAGGGTAVACTVRVCLNQNAHLDLGIGNSFYAICILLFSPVCILTI